MSEAWSLLPVFAYPDYKICQIVLESSLSEFGRGCVSPALRRRRRRG